MYIAFEVDALKFVESASATGSMDQSDHGDDTTALFVNRSTV